MEQYAGLDVSLESTSICIVDGDGRIVRESKVPSEPEALIGWFQTHGTAMARIGLEAGPLPQWLFAGLQSAGLPAELIETRHVRAAFNNGLSQEDIKELLIQAAVYAGVPAANHAFKEAASVIAEIEAEKAKG